MEQERGTTLDDPVDVNQKPNLQGSNHQITEYLKDQGAYDIFTFLLKDLLTQQPEDPLKHMLKCLQTEYPFGPLKVLIASPPCVGRSRQARRLAEHFGLEYISAGELLREAGIETEGVGYADETQSAELVMQRVQQATENMQGFVLDGFPRTRYQTSFLKDSSVVPTHVLVLTASAEQIRLRQQLIAQGRLELPGEVAISEEAMELKLRLHSCHSSSALEVYEDKISLIPVQQGESGEEAMWAQMESRVRILPRSNGPAPPPRVLLLGPRGIGIKEHASRLAARLGAVFVDGADFPLDSATGLPTPRQPASARTPKSRRGSEPSPRVSQPSPGTDGLPLLDAQSPGSTAKAPQPGTPLRKSSQKKGSVMQRARTSLQLEAVVDPRERLGAIGKRLRDPDCAKQGYVVAGFPTTEGLARSLSDDNRLSPTRVVVLKAAADTCVRRLRNILTDVVTQKVWTSLPRNETIRKRLIRKPEDHPNIVREEHFAHSRDVGAILDILNSSNQCTTIEADGPPEAVHSAIVEFVERPLPLPPRE